MIFLWSDAKYKCFKSKDMFEESDGTDSEGNYRKFNTLILKCIFRSAFSVKEWLRINLGDEEFTIW